MPEKQIGRADTQIVKQETIITIMDIPLTITMIWTGTGKQIAHTILTIKQIIAVVPQENPLDLQPATHIRN